MISWERGNEGQRARRCNLQIAWHVLHTVSCAAAKTHYTGAVYVGKINGKSLRDKEKLLREETTVLCHNSFGGRTLYLALVVFLCVCVCTYTILRLNSVFWKRNNMSCIVRTTIVSIKKKKRKQEDDLLLNSIILEEMTNLNNDNVDETYTTGKSSSVFSHNFTFWNVYCIAR